MTEFTRFAELRDPGQDTPEGDYIVPMAFASDAPYERWWGVEVLDMQAKSVRLQRLNDGAAVLYNHDWNELRGTHVPKSCKTEGGKLRGQIRLTGATQAGRDTIALVKSGVLGKASVGYFIHRVIEESTKKDGSRAIRTVDGRAFERLVTRAAGMRRSGDAAQDRAAFLRQLDAEVGEVIERAEDVPPTFRVVDWEPFENSLVTVPADPSVGVGRQAEAPQAAPAQPAAPAAPLKKEVRVTQAVETPAAGDDAAKLSAVELEKQRRQAVQQLAKVNRIDSRIEDQWIREGTPLTEIASQILAVHEERGKSKPQSAADLGLSGGDMRRYSIFRALRMLSATNHAEAQRAASDASFEMECSRAVAKQLGREPNGIFVPADVLRAPIDPESARRAIAARALTTSPGSAGGYLVETDNLDFISILRNRSVLSRMGARTLSGLSGNVTLPRQTGAATLTWQTGQTSAATPTDQTFGQLSMTPKTAIAVTEIGRELMIQSSPSAESLVMADLAQVVALGVDLAGIQGTGGSQPIGVLNTTGITTGQDAATADYAKVLAFQTAAANSNAILGSAGYICRPATAAALMARSRFANTDTPLWDGNILDGRMAGFPAMSSLQVPASNLVFGSWNEVVIGEWGVLELSMNPYQSFNAGVVGIRAIYSVDVLVRYPQAFVRSTNAS